MADLPNAVLICSPIPIGCELICWRVSQAYAPTITFYASLPASAFFYAWITDKFGNQYRWYFESTNLSEFPLDTTKFPDGMFNPDAGTFDIFFSFDINGVDIVPILPTTCLKLNTTC
jgi:hypothetical protein